MTIKTQIQFKEYLHLLYKLTYQKPLNIGLTIVGGLLLLVFLLDITTSLLAGVAITHHFLFMFLVLWGSLTTFLIPFGVYRQAKKTYFTDGRIKELITYEFTPEALNVQGESFSATLSWNKLYKAVEMKDWILLYQNHLVANLIPKRVLEEEQLHALRTILKAQPGLVKT